MFGPLRITNCCGHDCSEYFVFFGVRAVSDQSTVDSVAIEGDMAIAVIPANLGK